MITGTVSNRRATVRLLVRSQSGQEGEILTVLDTGFNGFLTLPPSMIRALNLPFLSYLNAGLADGTRVRLEVYAATVLWGGVEREIEVLAAGREPLMGTSLLDGHTLTIQ